MKKLFLIGLLALTACNICWGVPAKKGWFNVTKTDGTTVEAELVGDEFWHGMVTREGTLLREIQPDIFESTETNIADVDIAGLKAQSLLKQRETEYKRIRSIADGDKMKPMGIGDMNFPGKVLVILVSFSDKAFTKTNSAFNDMMNEETGSCNNKSGSVKQYFQNNSYGKYNPTFDVYGPYTLDHNCAYYGKNYGGQGSDQNAPQMIADAAAKLAADKGNSIFQQYDCDNDGYVDNVFVFYAGYGENAGASSSTIWPHQSYVYESWVEGTTTYAGVTLGNYACTCELSGNSGSTMSGIGPFCHEFSHVIGLPDLYDTGYSGHRTCSLWDVMDAGNYLNNEHTPPAYSAYERFYLGWLKPTVLSEPDIPELDDINNGQGQAYLISSTERHNLNGANPNPSEFFLLENRQQKGWDSYLPGEGMLITKISYDEYKWYSNTVNNDRYDMGVDIIEADGVHGYYAQASDAFPGTSNVTSYTPYDSQSLTDIEDDFGTIRFKYKGGRQYFKVDFDAMGRANCDTQELIENGIGAGIVLPNVSNVFKGYKFEGWCESSSAAEVSAGVPGETYYPTGDIELFAVYSQGGTIIPTETGCATETFDGLTKSKNTEITDKIDKYADWTGWNGIKVFCDNGAAKCGNNDEKGKLVSPRMRLSGDMTITVRAKALIATNMILSSGMATDTILISKSYDDYVFHLYNVQLDSRITIQCDANIFYVDNIEFCGAKKSPVEDVKTNEEIVVVRDGSDRIVYGLEDGDMVRVMDMTGKIVIDEQASGSSFVFNGGHSLYVIEVRRKGSTFAVVLN